MKAFLLCAGLGTRLRPLTDRVAKPVVPLFGRPLLEHAFEWLLQQGVTDVVVNTHHLPQSVESALARLPLSRMGVTLVHESTLLGTGGGLRNVAEQFSGERAFLTANGDVFTDLDATHALAAHTDLATLVTLDDPRLAALFGVGVDALGRVTDFWGQPEGTSPVRRVAFSGIQVAGPALLARLEREVDAGTPACIKERGWIPALRDGEHIATVAGQGAWFDLGTPQAYLDAHRRLSPRAASLSGWPERAPGIISAEPLPSQLQVVAPAVIGPGLTTRGPARLGPHAYLGTGVTLASAVSLEQVVVWDHVAVPQSQRNAILPWTGCVVSAL